MSTQLVINELYYGFFKQIIIVWLQIHYTTSYLKWVRWIFQFPFTALEIPCQAFFGDTHNYGGPDVWLSLIRDAEYVITDSFHAVVFSIIYRKRFAVLRRSGDGEMGSMNSRMYSLCKIFPEIDGWIVGVDICDANIVSVNTTENLSQLKIKSKSWLKSSIC